MAAPGTAQPAAKCPVEMYDATPCGRDPYDDKGRCICHSDKPDKDATALQREISAMLERKDYDFTCFVFPDDANRFGTTFEGAVWFPGATFHGPASFVDARFQGDVDFTAATFCDSADFSDRMFCGRTDFSHAEFREEASFHKAEFHDRACFVGTKFHSAAEFTQAMFTGVACFTTAKFQESAYFGGAAFLDKAMFEHAAFQSTAVFDGYEDEWVFSREADVDFRLAHFAQAENVLFEHVFLGRARFLRTDIRNVDFTDVEWARRSGGRFALWDELRPEDDGEKKDHAVIGKLYRQLKHNYEEQRDPITAGDFHFGEMHMRRLSNPPRNAILRFLKRNLSFLAFYRWISGYGEDYLLPLAWIVGVILAFALAFASIPAIALRTVASSGASHAVAGLRPHLLYSLMCFLLRGDKPLEPMYLGGHCASVAEGIIGPPLIALFILALNRRFKR